MTAGEFLRCEGTDVRQHFGEFLRWLRSGKVEQTVEGVILGGSVRARGIYTPYIDGVAQAREPNLVPLEGLEYFLSAGLGADTQQTAWYLALFSGAVTPVAGWTAANFATNASEITSSVEGYSNPTRPQWMPDAVSGGIIANAGSLAAYNIVCTTNISIAGAGLLSSSVKGGAGGILASATRFETPHTVNNGSTFELGYEVELTDS